MVATIAGFQRLYRSLYELFLIFRGNRRGLFGLCILVFFVLMATVGPHVVPLDMSADYDVRFQLPSWSHLLGTDYAGRDVLAQIVHGSRDVILVSFLAAVFAVSIAIVVGIVSGLKGGFLDSILMMIVNIVLTLPRLPFMMIIAAAFKVKDPFSFGLLLAIWSWAGLARAIRSQIFSLKEREFIEATKVLGLSTSHIVLRELLPNIMSYVAINFIFIMRGAIVASVALMFLGLVPFSVMNWGTMLNLATFQTGAIYVPKAIFYVISPMAAIVLFQLGGVYFIYGLEEVFNPRLREHK